MGDMTTEEFLRVYPIRAQNLMWLLGAGASAPAGIPTASSLIWEFKRVLFCSAQRVSLKVCEDLSSLVVRQKLNDYFRSTGRFPAVNSPDEYAAYFEAAYPNPRDRRSVLEKFMIGIKPSFGYLVLAALMKMDKVRMVWTTNFDKLLEDAATQFLGSTSKFTVATLDNSETAMRVINESTWPLIGKLHGDFQSQSLKNTSEELQMQDAEIRRALVESCKRYGLIVVGYSGRDESVLNALEQAVDSGRGYPQGLFWFQREGSSVLPAVSSLISKARHCGIQAELLGLQTFDELLGDIVRQVGDIPMDIQMKLDSHVTRIREIPLEPPGRNWPVIRLNALPIMSFPTICRLVVCRIGGIKEVRQAIAQQGAKAIAVRARLGVLAFGSDAEIRTAFEPFQVTGFDCYIIEPKRLRNDSAELVLLRDAFALAIQAAGPFLIKRSNSSHVLVLDSSRASFPNLVRLKNCTGSLGGIVAKTGIVWSEALRFCLDYRLGKLWLLIEPTIYLDYMNETENRHIANDFVRERLATRYNRQWNELIEAWLFLLFGDEKERQLTSFAIMDGIDASFTIGRITGFSRRSSNK